MAYFPLGMTQVNPPATTTSATSNNTAQNQIPQQNLPLAGRFFDPARAEEIIRTNGGYELVIAPLYKRFLAEVIDTVILFIVKILFFVFFLDFLEISWMYVSLKFINIQTSTLINFV